MPLRADEVVIAALAFRGDAEAVARWSPTAAYLSERVPGVDFRVEPFELESLRQATAAQQIDFVLTNPGQYVTLEAEFGISRIATLQTRYGNEAFTRFGSVVLARSGRKDLHGLADLAGKRLMAISPDAFGGFQMVWRELKAVGLDPYRDLADLEFSGFPQDSVVEAVLEGRVDAGVVRSGVLERMVQEGRIPAGALKVLGERRSPDFPPRHSTRLYPEWPLAKLRQTPEMLAKQVAQVLLAMPPEHPAARAAHINGWTIPLSYGPVHQLLRELRIGPYSDLGRVTWRDLVREHTPALIATLSIMLVLTGAIAWVGRVNRELADSRRALARQRDGLEKEVARRTAELRRLNAALEEDVRARRVAERSLTRSRTALQMLYELSVDPGIEHAHKLVALLSLGKTHFGHQAAVLFRIEADGYHVCTAVDGEPFVESVADCIARIGELHDILEAGPKQGCGNAMLACPVWVGGRQRCLLAFVGETQRTSGLDELDRELLRLMALWIGAEMERREAEAEREQHRKQLERVARTHTMGEIASSLAHELNQPLTAARNFLGGTLRLLSEDTGDAGVRRGLESALEGVTRASDIVQRLRSYVKTGIPAQERFDLNGAVSRVIELAAAELRHSGVALETQLRTESLWVRGDSIQIEQVILNLILNAVQASHSGDRVTITTAIDNGRARFTIADQGRGFDERDRERIFQPFFSTRPDGMGLGLAISRSVVEAHGSQLHVAAVPGGGTRFDFELSLAEEEDEPVRVPGG